MCADSREEPRRGTWQNLSVVYLAGVETCRKYFHLQNAALPMRGVSAYVVKMIIVRKRIAAVAVA